MTPVHDACLREPMAPVVVRPSHYARQPRRCGGGGTGIQPGIIA